MQPCKGQSLLFGCLLYTSEQFYEYTYDLDTIRAALEKHGFALDSVCDGESFGPLTDESERCV